MSKVPVFILGINPRSGTNYLFQLLSLHPDCVESKHYGEDFIVYGSDMLLKYMDKVTSKWAIEWKNDPELFKSSVESGIMHYLDPGNNNARYVVTKTPDATNADIYLDNFEDGKIILITRKGQDLTESFLKTFKGRFDDAVRGWSVGANNLIKILNNRKRMDTGRVICIKYEDLYQQNEQVMRKIFSFLELNPERYDFTKSENYDVIGSSTFTGESDTVTWDPVEKDDTFNPLNRFAHWSRFKHYRFNWLAGKESDFFEYELYYNKKGLEYYFYNFIMMTIDFSWRVIRRIYFTITGNKDGK